jgi:CheY-like chemotaxis protein
MSDIQSTTANPAPIGTIPPEMMRALKERFRTSTLRTCAAFRTLGLQLATTPDAPEVVDAVRRELHRVHGTAGSYGFGEASNLAAKLEDRAIRWASDPELDRESRGAMIIEFADVLALAVGDPDAGSAVAAAPEPQPAASSAEVPDVIVVEDDGPLQEMILYALRSGGFTVSAFAEGPRALEALLAMPVPTDGRRPLVLLDVDLPGIDGHSLHERLRVQRPGVFGFVFQTVHGGEAEQVRALTNGALDYVVKPLNLRVLLAKIPMWIRRG